MLTTLIQAHSHAYGLRVSIATRTKATTKCLLSRSYARRMVRILQRFHGTQLMSNVLGSNPPQAGRTCPQRTKCPRCSRRTSFHNHFGLQFPRPRHIVHAGILAFNESGQDQQLTSCIARLLSRGRSLQLPPPRTSLQRSYLPILRR
jgi:hypothetical protein